MTKEQKKYKQAVKDADVKQDGWDSVVLDGMTNLYAKGYITAKMEMFAEIDHINSESGREEMLSFLDYSIW